MNIQKILAALILAGLTISLVIFGLQLNKKSEESSFLNEQDVCIQANAYCSWYAEAPFDKDTPCCPGSTCNKHSFVPFCFPDNLE